MGNHARLPEEDEIMTHTPGPWEIIPEGNNFPDYTISMRDPEGARWAPIAITQNGNSTYPHITVSRKTQLANARLIAKSPEMLDVLREFIEIHDAKYVSAMADDADRSLYDEHMDGCRALLAEIEGN